MDSFVHIQGLHIKNFKALADIRWGVYGMSRRQSR